VFFAFLLGAAVSNGGVLTLNMTHFGEMWWEYVLLCILAAVGPWALYKIDRDGRHNTMSNDENIRHGGIDSSDEDRNDRGREVAA